MSVFDNTQCKLGEGPTYCPVQDRTWWFDIEGKRLFEHDFASRQTRIHELPVMASMLGVIDETQQLIACEDGLYLRNTGDGALTLHHPLEDDDPLTRSNDGRVHPSGALWIGTMSKEMAKGAGAVYWFYKGQLRQLFGDITVPNAICFSPDGRMAYYTDTPSRKLMRVAIDPANGFPKAEPQIFYEHSDNPGWQDGAVIDRQGNLWNACWQGSCVIKISPSGELMQSYPVEPYQPTCPVFIGKNLNQMLVTSAWVGLDEQGRRTSVDGNTCWLDVTVEGKPEPRILL